MACDLSLGRLIPCKDVVGGLKAVFFMNAGDMTGVTYDAVNTDVIETITGTPSGYKYDLKGASSFEQTIVTSRETGTTYFEQVLNLVLNKQDIATHKQVKLLAYGNPNVIVVDNNSNYFMCGLKFGMDVTGGTITTGGAMGDANGYTLTLTGMEPVPANFLEATTDALLTTAGVTIVLGA